MYNNRGLIDKERVRQGILTTSGVIIIGYAVIKVLTFIVPKITAFFAPAV